MTARLREAARRLLAEGKVQVVIGWGEHGKPVFVRSPGDAKKLAWNHRCFANLTVYLKRKEVRALGKLALVVKGCDERALVVLEQESQVERSEVHVIGWRATAWACPSAPLARCGSRASPMKSSASPRRVRPARWKAPWRAAEALAARALRLLESGARALHALLRLPPGVPAVLLRALRGGQEPSRGH